jgi:predicted nucleotide-binding protein
MANRRSPQRPAIEPKIFKSVAEIDEGIVKLRRRIKDLEELNPQTIRYNDQRIRNVESQIRDTILGIFEENSPEFQEHRYHEIWEGPQYANMSEWALQQGVEKGISQSKTMLEGLISRLEEKKLDFSPPETDLSQPAGNAVFLVHGRNDSIRETVARFLERFGLKVIILHEQADQGRTIIEKFEDHSQDAGFAVVLLTGDDRGGTKDEVAATYQPRARQNVIFELGFFIGKLKRRKVAALYEEGVEIPSDYQGVLFIKMDADWKLKLAREIKAGGFHIDLNKAL